MGVIFLLRQNCNGYYICITFILRGGGCNGYKGGKYYEKVLVLLSLNIQHSMAKAQVILTLRGFETLVGLGWV